MYKCYCLADILIFMFQRRKMSEAQMSEVQGSRRKWVGWRKCRIIPPHTNTHTHTHTHTHNHTLLQLLHTTTDDDSLRLFLFWCKTDFFLTSHPHSPYITVCGMSGFGRGPSRRATSASHGSTQ
jgi:hypothetical protein